MSSALATVTPGFMQPQMWQMMTQQAEVLVTSGFLPASIKTSQQAIAIIMVGYELGIQPWQALSTINVIQGKPTISPQLMLALIQRSKQLESMAVDGNAQQCTVIMTRKGQGTHVEIFTLEDAKKMGLAGRDNWLKQPGTMLKWRAMAACARVLFPDVILGLYTDDEMVAEIAEPETLQPKLEVVRTAEPEVTEGEIVEEAPLVGQPQPAPQKPQRRVDTSKGAPQNGKPAPERKPTAKPQGLRAELLATFEHPYYGNPTHLKNAIEKLFEADIFYERMPVAEAARLLDKLASNRANGLEPEAAIEAVRKLLTQQEKE